MGLMDILNGMQAGPRGRPQPGAASGGGGMSPLTMALIGLLAYKALKGSSRASAAPSAPAGPTGPASQASGGLGDILGGLLGGKPGAAPPGGANLNDLLKGGLGGLLGGGQAGTVLSDGLGNLIKEVQESGHGRAAQSWVGTGPNEDIAPKDLENALGSGTLDTLARHTGMSRSDLLAGLSQNLPELIDQLTPHGRVPTPEEAGRMV